MVQEFSLGVPWAPRSSRYIHIRSKEVRIPMHTWNAFHPTQIFRQCHRYQRAPQCLWCWNPLCFRRPNSNARCTCHSSRLLANFRPTMSPFQQHLLKGFYNAFINLTTVNNSVVTFRCTKKLQRKCMDSMNIEQAILQQLLANNTVAAVGQ